VLLAAGLASRMGHRPKALLERDGQPLIRRAIDALHGAGATQVVVVLGHHAQAIAPALQGLPVRSVLNPDPAAEQPASLRCGLLALDGQADVLVALADQPLIDADAVAQLLAAYHRRPAGTELVQPEVDGQPGNPVVFSPRVREQMLAAPQGMSGRQWQARHPGQAWRWVSADRRYVVDLDSPADLAWLASEQGIDLRWPDALLG
jgi:molybdenum cofactor cytidylyltransferase